MAAPKKNTYWKLAKGFAVGKDKKYTPAELWKLALSYFNWVDSTPLKEEKVFGTGIRMEVNKMRAMTIRGFCLHAGISSQTFDNYNNQDEYRDVTTRIKDIIYVYKFEGAAAGLLDVNIIARELGLSDKVESQITGKDGKDLRLNLMIKPTSLPCKTTLINSENEIEL